MQQQESAGRKIWKIISPSILFFVVTVLVEAFFLTFLTSSHTEIFGLGSYEEMMEAFYKLTAQYQYEMSVVAVAAVLPLLVNMLRRDILERKASNTLAIYEKPDPLDYIKAAVMGVSFCILANCLIHISGIYSLLEGETVVEQTQAGIGKLLLEILGVGILSAAAEEIAFRALTLQRIEERFGTQAALIGSSLIFAFYHGSTLQTFYAFLVGLVAGFLYLRFRTVLAPFLFHMSANLVSVLQNETHFLDSFFETTAGLVAVCLVSAVAFLVYFYLVLSKVNVAKLNEDSLNPEDNTGEQETY